jgi:hypothetical protein
LETRRIAKLRERYSEVNKERSLRAKQKKKEFMETARNE